MGIYRSLIVYAADASEVRSSVPALAGLAGGVELPLHSSRGAPIQLVYPTIAFLTLAMVSEFVLRRTVLGRRVMAVGDNPVAARYAGIPIGRVSIMVYGFVGLTCGLSALFNAGRLMSVSSSSTGMFYELNAIAAVIVGGTSMNGGRGSMLGTVVGVLLLAVIENMLTMLDVNPYLQDAVKGCIIIAAVLVRRGRRAA
jgi:ribose transport system permease protein